jgi:hypothetical protein
MTGGTADRASLHKKANAELDANLRPDESVEVIINGPSNQAVIGTDRRVFVYKKGFMAGATFGAEMTSWDYRNLVGVQIHTGMMSGAVVLQAPGQSGIKTSVWASGDGDPYKAPNAIPINRPFDQAKVGVGRLRELIETAHRESPNAAGAPVAGSGPSLADELKKLADLRATGVLSDDEFVALKAKLLSN